MAHNDLVTCGQAGTYADWLPHSDRYGTPVCNRVHKHPPPHRVYDAHTFSVLAEWRDKQARKTKSA